jgi:hypothetical protein
MASSIDGDEDPKRKRPRLSSIPDAANVSRSETKDDKQARIEVREVLKVWEQIHGRLGENARVDAENAREVFKSVQTFKHGRPGNFALAACWKGIIERVRSSSLTMCHWLLGTFVHTRARTLGMIAASKIPLCLAFVCEYDSVRVFVNAGNLCKLTQVCLSTTDCCHRISASAAAPQSMILVPVTNPPRVQCQAVCRLRWTPSLPCKS